MFHDVSPPKCYNHKDRDAKFYEDQSELNFCADCKQGLKNASERDLYLMTHPEKLDVKGVTALSDEELAEELKKKNKFSKKN